jgi:regulator of RNase E activity RraA
VSIGGLVVRQGDLVVGDDDGVLAIAPDHAPTVVAAALRKETREIASLTEIADSTYDLGWVTAQWEVRQQT